MREMAGSFESMTLPVCRMLLVTFMSYKDGILCIILCYSPLVIEEGS
jgi:hypothetical protein